jgi:Tfp pilus assembly protein PilO
MFALIERYRDLGLFKRNIVFAVIVFSYYGYTFYEEYSVLQEELLSESSLLEAAKGKYENNKNKIKGLPDLKVEVQELRLKLNKFYEKIPSKFFIGVVLKNIISASEESGVEIDVFDPEEKVRVNKVDNYSTKIISLKIVGSYDKIVGFFSSLLDKKLLFNISSYSLKLKSTDEDKPEEADSAAEKEITLDAKVNIIVYKSNN